MERGGSGALTYGDHGCAIVGVVQGASGGIHPKERLLDLEKGGLAATGDHHVEVFQPFLRARLLAHPACEQREPWHFHRTVMPRTTSTKMQ